MKIVHFSMVMLSAFVLALAAAPSNDSSSGATVVSLPFSEELDTSEATTDTEDSQLNGSCGAPFTDASVWYEYTAVSDTTVVVDVSQSNYAAGVIVGEGTGPGDLSTVTCGPFTVSFAAFAGTTYYVLAFDFDGGTNGGNLVISFDEAEVPVLETFTVNNFGTVNTRTGIATISGTYSCTGASFISLFVNARQNVGRFVIQGFGSLYAEDNACDGSLKSWSADVEPNNGKFAGGKSLTVTSSFGCGDLGCFDGFEEKTIQLRGGGGKGRKLEN